MCVDQLSEIFDIDKNISLLLILFFQNSCEGAINLKLIPAPISSDVEQTQVVIRAPVILTNF